MTYQEAKAKAEQVSGRRLELAQQVAGVVWVTTRDGHKFALVPSDSHPGTYYQVDGRGCACKGYAYRGHCRHYDSVMMKLVRRRGERCPALQSVAFEGAEKMREVA